MIVLTVLKIIGIVILCILALAILILLSVLFLPLRYKVRADYDSESGDYYLNLDIKWFLGILKIYGNLDKENGLDYWAKFFGKKIFSKDDEDEEDFEEDDYPELTEEYSDSRAKGESPEQTAGKEEPEEDSSTKVSLTKEELTEESGESEEAKEEAEEETKLPEIRKVRKKRGFLGKIKAFLDKISRFFQNIRYKTKAVCDKIKSVRDIIIYYKNLLEDEESKRAFAKAWNETKFFARKLKPGKFSLKIHYGAEDPSETGINYGRFAAITTFIGKEVRMLPDFEKKIIHADLFMKGAFRLYVLLVIACRLYFDKRFMKVVKRFRRRV